MADIVTLRAQARDRAGKGAARAARREGRVPGVIYGDGKPVTLVTLDPRDLDRELARPGFFARLLNVEINGTIHPTLPRDVQNDPVTDRPLHVDFLRVHAGTRVTVDVPVLFVGHERSPGIRRGGMLNIVRHELELISPVENIPDRITVNLEGLQIGDSVHVSSISLPEGTHPTLTRNFTIASIAAPTAVREEQAAVAEAAAAAPVEGETVAAAPAAAPAAKS